MEIWKGDNDALDVSYKLDGTNVVSLALALCYFHVIPVLWKMKQRFKVTYQGQEAGKWSKGNLNSVLRAAPLLPKYQ